MIAAKSLTRRLSLVVSLLALGFAAQNASAQSDEADASNVSFTVLHRFGGGQHGANPTAGLVQDTNGYLYGTTPGDGFQTFGTVFKIALGGAFTTVYTFCSPETADCAKVPVAGLVLATNGYLYGTTSMGGNGGGTIFKMSPSGTPINFYSFCGPSCPDSPTFPDSGTLVQAANGDLYGTTSNGGASGVGAVYKITPQGAITTLYSFCSEPGCLDGEYPHGGLVQASNGDLYGTTTNGGNTSSFCLNNSCGTIFKITPSGTLTTIYSFCSEPGCTDGATPYAALVQATNGYLYGTTGLGGSNCRTGSAVGCGTVFKMTPGGTLTTLYSFCSQPGCTDGSVPGAPLIQAASGDLYGTTPDGGAGNGGGANGVGTIFKITPSGTLNTLYSFCVLSGCPDGGRPAGLVEGTNGIFYGTTDQGGGDCDCGTVFSLSTGQAPFVETRPTIGKVGEAVTILGYKLTGATSVTFNGVPVAFTVHGSTAISTTVPVGATTGKVQVITPGGTLSSNVAFEVVP